MPPIEQATGLPQGFLGLDTLAHLLVRHYGYKEGLFDVTFAMQIAIGQVGQTGRVLPGAALGISGVGLVPAKEVGPLTIDAATVPALPASPAVKPKRKSAAK